MEKNTSDYSAIKWINKNIPDNSVIISELRAISLFKIEQYLREIDC